MRTKRMSIRFDLDDPVECAAWDFLHNSNTKSANRVVIDAISNMRRYNDLESLIKDTICNALQDISLSLIQPSDIPTKQDNIVVLDFLDAF